MQEEVENRTVNLAISTTKLTFRTIVNGYNAWKRDVYKRQMHRHPHPCRRRSG